MTAIMVFSRFLGLCAPCSVALLFLLVEILSLPMPWAGALRPPLFLVAVYYGAVYRPGLVPFWAVFMAGLVRDALLGLPLGSGTLALLLVRWAVGRWRFLLTSQSFGALWVGFICVVLSAFGITWALTSLAQMQILPFIPGLIASGLATALFPALTYLLRRSYAFLPLSK